MTELRCPGQIDDPDVADRYPDVGPGLDTDADGHPDTVVLGDGVDLVLATDLDGDGYVDRVLRVGPDGVTREAGDPPAEVGDRVFSGPPETMLDR